MTTPEGRLDLNVVESIADQMAYVRRYIPRLLLVTSGAVATGCERYGRLRSDRETTRKKQHYASVGAYRVLVEYDDRLDVHGCVAAMMLLTRREIDSAVCRRHLRDTLEEIFADVVPTIPIINENDVIATRELRLTDNDQLAALMARMIRAEHVLILTGVPGILRDISDPTSLISTIPLGSTEHQRYIHDGTSENGKGGMRRKDHYAAWLAKQGIGVTIVDGRGTNVIVDVLLERQNPGTEYLTS